MEVFEAIMQKGVIVEWTGLHLAAVAACKPALCSDPVLAMLCWDEPFVLTADWLCAAVEAALSQLDPATGDYTLGTLLHLPQGALTSAATTPRGVFNTQVGGWTSLATACMVGPALLFLIHQNLVWMDSARCINGKLARWALALQGMHSQCIASRVKTVVLRMPVTGVMCSACWRCIPDLCSATVLVHGLTCCT